MNPNGGSMDPVTAEDNHTSAEYLCEILDSLPNTDQLYRNVIESTSSEESGEQSASLPSSELRRLLSAGESKNQMSGETVEKDLLSKTTAHNGTPPSDHIQNGIVEIRSNLAVFSEDLSKSNETFQSDNVESGQSSNGGTKLPLKPQNETCSSEDFIPDETARLCSLTTLTSSLTGSLSTRDSHDASPNEVPAPGSTLPEERVIMSPSALFPEGELSYFESLISEHIEADLSGGTAGSSKMLNESFWFPASSGMVIPSALSASETDNLASNNMTTDGCYQSYETDTDESNHFIDSSVKRKRFEKESKVERSDASLVNDEPQVLNCIAKDTGPRKISLSTEINENNNEGLDRISNRLPNMDITNTVYSHIKRPFWKQDSGGDSVYKADTPTITALCGEDDGDATDFSGQAIQDAQDTEMLPDPIFKTQVESDLSRNIQDEMLNIIRELRRLSAGEDSVVDPEHDVETSDLIYPPPQGRWNCNRITKTVSYKTKGSAQHLRSDNLEGLSPISEVSGESKNNSHSAPGKYQDTDTSKQVPELTNVSWRSPTIGQIKKYPMNFDPKHLTTNTVVSSLAEYTNQNGNDKTQVQKVPLRESNQNAGQEVKVKQIEIEGMLEINKRFAKPHIIGGSENSRLKRVSFNLDDTVSDFESIQRSNQSEDYRDPLQFEKYPDINGVIDIPGLRSVLRVNSDRSYSSRKSRRNLKMAPRSKSLPEDFLDGNDESTDLGVSNMARVNKNNMHFTEGESQPPPRGTGEGTTNFAFVKDSPHLDQSSQCRVMKAHFSSDEESSDYDNDEEKGGLPKQAEDKHPRLTMVERRHLILRRQQSASVAPGTDNIRGKLTKAWSSLDSRVTESTPLAKSFPKTAPKNVGDAATSQDRGDCSLPELDQDISTSWSDVNVSEDGQTIVEEDTLSLEFFVPGKKQYIRLHRRTFIRFVLKYLIFFFTFLVWVGSVSAIGFGTWMLMSNGAIIDDVSDVFLDPYVLLCVVGGIIFLVTFFGCVGALRENICLLKLFHISLTTVLVLEGLLGTLVFLFYTMPEFRQAVKVGPEEILKKAVKQYFDDDGMKNWIDTVQREFQCCGVSMSNKGYLDWQDNIYFNCSDSNPSVHRCSVPISCCIFEPGDHINFWCGVGIMKETESHILHIINTKGCMKSFGEWLGKNDAMVGYVAMGVIVPQIIGVVAARYFVKHIQKHSASKQLSDPVKFISGL